ncbi:hypothetical protein [Clostridium nigeriense]|uniref:hypothetical protein n=1 Tax=Clostridium nigeriense TaxID=1805470 RepID=UPI000AADE650|nr:hypothetical protein [Clostridium nigeriense]
MDKSLIDLSNIGNFTKIAVKNFENNIVNKTDYLESVKRNKLGNEYDFKEDKYE